MKASNSGPAVSGTVEQGTNGAPLTQELCIPGVLVPNPSAVQEYLARFADQGPIVRAVCGKVRESFGPKAELSLELYVDPEIDDRFLVLYVRLETYDKLVMSKIDEACRPFDDVREKAEGYFLVTTDFRKARGMHAV